VLVLGAQVDLLHSASMLGLGVIDGPRRRIGLTDGVIAAAFAADEVTTARRAVAGAGSRLADGTAAGSPAGGPDGPYGDLIRYRDAAAGWLVARTLPRAFRAWLTGVAGAAIRSP
jgi:hypothetical protein